LRTTLKLFYLFVLGVMTWGTVQASLDRGVMQALAELGPDPWFKVTLYDTYFAFFSIWLWMAWKEDRWLWRFFWLAAVMILGNFAIASYVLMQLFRLRPGQPVGAILKRPS